METIQVSCCSILGDRTSQQDNVEYKRKGDTLLAVVCDGMGGMQGGEKASQLAVDTIFDAFSKQEVLEEGQINEWFYQTMKLADVAVSSLRNEKGEPMNAGTTVVAVLIKERNMYWCSVGDSRIYYMQQDVMHTVTRMHNYNLRLDELVATGAMTAEERESESGKGEALISFLGIGDLSLVDIGNQAHEMQKDDIIVLCSDGLYKGLDDQQILAIVQESGKNVEIAARRLCGEAFRLTMNKLDNTTVIVIRCCN